MPYSEKLSDTCVLNFLLYTQTNVITITAWYAISMYKDVLVRLSEKKLRTQESNIPPIRIDNVTNGIHHPSIIIGELVEPVNENSSRNKTVGQVVFQPSNGQLSKLVQ